MKYQKLYPQDWYERARRCKDAAGWRCQFCGIAHGAQVVSQRTGRVYMVCLAAAHLDHDPWNLNARLACLCQSCHMSYDYSYQEQQRWLALEVYRHQRLVSEYLLESYYQDEQS